MQEEPVSLRQLAARTVLTLAYLGAVGWWMAPAHTRALWGMRATAAASRVLNLAARRAGRAGMATELARGGPASDAYTLPYLLSRARDACAGAYARLRAGGGAL